METPDGGFLICGEAYLTGTQQTRPYLMKLTASGAVTWCKEYALFSGFHRAQAILKISGDLYVVLVDISTIQTPALFAVNGAGDYLVSLGYSVADLELTTDDVIRTSDGGLLLVGRTFHFATGQDVAVLKIGPTGVPQWYRELAGGLAFPLFGADDFASTAIEAADGNGHHVLGSMESNALLARFDLAGNVVFQKTYQLDGATVFETSLTFLERDGDSNLLVANANLANDKFPLILELDDAGELLSTTAGSFPMSATRSQPTADGGFAIAGSTLITPGVQGLRLAKYDAAANLAFAWQYDVMLTFATINPPANLTQTREGGYVVTVAGLAGFEPVQQVVRADAAGLLGCGLTAVPGPFPFTVTTPTPDITVSSLAVSFATLPFVESTLVVEASPDCP